MRGGVEVTEGLDRLAATGAVELLTFLSSALPGSTVRRVGEVVSVATGSPFVGVNVIVVQGAPAESEATLLDELNRLGDHSGPVQVAFRCSDRLGRRFRSMARRLGLRPLTEHRAMVYQPVGSIAEAPMSSLSVTPVQGPDDLRSHVQAMADAFGMERNSAARLFASELINEPRVRFFNGSIDGQVMATAAALRADGLASINNIGVAAAYRGRGLGTEMTLAAMRWAHRVESPSLVLDATASGLSIYKNLGFVEVDTVRFYQRKPIR